MGVKKYVVPVELTGWKTQDNTGAVQFSWDYDPGHEALIQTVRGAGYRFIPPSSSFS